MIIIISAQPRTGKTLYAVSQMEKMFPGRPIYHNGIPELKLPWIQVDPKEWTTAIGTNGVLVVDEAQDDFGPCAAGKEPEYIKELSKHGHRGIDIVFITQHPSFLNTYIRKNCGKHIHMYRAFGWKGAQVYEWGKYDDSFDTDTRRKLALSSRFSYPQEAFGLYKSADAHTVKASYPKIFFVLPLIAVVIAFSGYKLFNHYSDMATRGKEATLSTARGATVADAAKPLQEMINGKRDPMRAQGLDVGAAGQAEQPWLQPQYAKLIEPQRAPVPAGCIIKKINEVESCTCYTEDATIVQATAKFCNEYVQGRIFAEWRNPNGRKEPVAGDMPAQRAAPGVQVDARPGQEYRAIDLAGANYSAHRSSDWTIPPKYQ